jgi:hypothetical protein
MMVTNIIIRDILLEDLTAARLNAEAAWQEAGKLRAALEMAEWCDGACFWCCSLQRDGHAPDCPRQLALYPPEPEEPRG